MDVNRGAERRRTSIWNHTTLTQKDSNCVRAQSVRWCRLVCFFKFCESAGNVMMWWEWIQNNLWLDKAALSYFTARIAPAASITLKFVYTFALDEQASWHTLHTNTHSSSFSLTFSVSHFTAMVVCFAAQWDAIVIPMTFLCVRVCPYVSVYM